MIPETMCQDVTETYIDAISKYLDAEVEKVIFENVDGKMYFTVKLSQSIEQIKISVKVD